MTNTTRKMMIHSRPSLLSITSVPLARAVLLAALALAPVRAQTVEPHYLALHDVTDLVGVSRASLGLEGDGQTDEAALQQALWGELGALVGDPRSRLSGRFGSILLVGTAEAHRRAHRYLDGLRQLRSGLARCQVTVARYSPELLDRVAAAGSSRSLDVGDRQGFQIDEAQFLTLQAAIDAGEGAELVDRIVLASAAGDSAGWHRKLETSYVADAIVRVLKGGAFADPRIATLWHGYELAITPLAQAGGVELSLQLRSLERVDRIETPFGIIQVPVQVTQEVSGKGLQAPPEGALLLPGLVDPFPLEPAGHRSSTRGLLVCIRSLPSPPESGPSAPPAWLGDPAAREARLVPTGVPAGEPKLTVFDVRDLVDGIQDFFAPELGFGADGEEGQEGQEGAESTRDGTRELAAWIRENVAPQTPSGAGVSVQDRGGNLVVRHTPAVLSLIERLLTDLRRGNGPLLSLEVQFLVIPVQRGVAVTAAGLVVGDTTHHWGEVVDPAAILGGAQGGKGVQVVSAPRVTVLPSQRSSILIVNQTAYISDFDVTVASEDGSGEPTLLGDPVVDTLQTGLALESRATPMAGRQEILLEIELQLSEAETPIDTIDFPLHGSKVTIQVPSVRSSSVRTALRVPDGKTILLASPTLVLEGNRSGQAILVKATLVDLEER